MAGYISEFFGYRAEDNPHKLQQQQLVRFVLFSELNAQKFCRGIELFLESVQFDRKHQGLRMSSVVQIGFMPKITRCST